MLKQQTVSCYASPCPSVTDTCGVFGWTSLTEKVALEQVSSLPNGLGPFHTGPFCDPRRCTDWYFQFCFLCHIVNFHSSIQYPIPVHKGNGVYNSVTGVYDRSMQMIRCIYVPETFCYLLVGLQIICNAKMAQLKRKSSKSDM